MIDEQEENRGFFRGAGRASESSELSIAMADFRELFQINNNSLVGKTKDEPISESERQTLSRAINSVNVVASMSKRRISIFVDHLAVALEREGRAKVFSSAPTDFPLRKMIAARLTQAIDDDINYHDDNELAASVGGKFAKVIGVPVTDILWIMEYPDLIPLELRGQRLTLTQIAELVIRKKQTLDTGQLPLL